MGFNDLLKKAGLIEGAPVESTEELMAKVGAMKIEMQPQVSLPQEMSLNGLLTVDQIYQEFGMNDMGKSIFKVDEFANIPGIKDLATDVRRAAVLGTLSASGLNVESLVTDANERIGALSETLEGFTFETDTQVENGEAEIEALTAKIDGIKQAINDRKKLQEAQASLIKDESDKINKIVNFINPSK